MVASGNSPLDSASVRFIDQSSYKDALLIVVYNSLDRSNLLDSNLFIRLFSSEYT